MKHLLAIFTLIFSCHSLIASDFDRKSTSLLFKNSTNIFLGEVVRKETFKDQKDNHVYTKNYVVINKNIKGTDSKTRIILTLGGVFNNEVYTISHSPNLTEGEKYIFFCTSISKESDYLNFTEYDQQSLIQFSKYVFDPYASGFDRVFKTEYDLTIFFKNNSVNLPTLKDYRVKRNIKHKPSLSPEELHIKLVENIKAFNAKIKPTEDLIEKKRLKKTTSSLRTASNHTVTYSLENYKYTLDNNSDFVEFDIFIKASETVYYDRSLFRINYNTEAFDDNIFVNGNLIVTAGSEFNKPATYDLDNLVADITPNKIAVFLGVPGFDVTNRTLISSTPKLLLHFKIATGFKVNQTSELTSGIEFTETSLTEKFSFYSKTSSESGLSAENFDDVTYLNTFSNRLVAKPVISSFTPTSVIGGIDQIITIKGYNFGQNRGSSNDAIVQFRDADEAGSNANTGEPVYISVLDQSDYITWTDDEIKVKVPSIQILSLLDDKGVAGSGTFRIINYGSIFQGSSSSPLEVKYSISNTTGIKNKKGIIYTVANKSDNSISFRVTQEIINNPNILKSIDAAIKEWKCELGIDIILEKDNNGNLIPGIFNGNGGSGNIFTLIVPPVGFKNKNAWTASVAGVCEAGENVTYFRKNISININSEKINQFLFEPSFVEFVPQGKIDLKGTIMHEIGHSIGLAHVCNIDNSRGFSDELMFPFSPIPGSRRRYIANYSFDGARDILDRSQSKSFAGNCSVTKVKTTQFCTVVGINELEDNANIVYPNPVSGDGLYLNDRLLNSVLNVRFITSSGQELLSDHQKGASRINISLLEPGIYILELQTPTEIIRRQIIKI